MLERGPRGFNQQEDSVSDDPVIMALLAALCPSIAEAAPKTDLPPRRLGVAVSGGLDSMVLLDAIAGLAHDFGLSLRVLHLDHGWRADSADVADFVAETARSRHLPLSRERAEGLPTTGPSPEAHARTARYAFFRRIASEHQLEAVLLAHHRDDQRETVTHNLLRGSGPLELPGMPEQRLLAPDTPTRLLRPLLGLDRATLRNYASVRALPWREDPSNRDLRHRRNRIRHEILATVDADALAAGPKLRLDGLDQRGRALARRADELALRLSAEIIGARHGPHPLPPQALDLNLERLRNLPPPLAERVLAHALQTLGFDAPGRVSVSRRALRRLLQNDRGSESVELRPQASVVMTSTGRGRLVDQRRWSTIPERQLTPNDDVVTLALFGLDLVLQSPTPSLALTSDFKRGGVWDQAFPAATDALWLRSPREDDVIHPFGSSTRALSLREFLKERGVPASRRAGYPLIADAEGPLWALGLPPDRRVTVVANTAFRRLALRPHAKGPERRRRPSPF